MYGFDGLAAVLYPKTYLKSLRKGESGGIFMTTFKDSKGRDAKELIARVVEAGKLSDFVVHVAPFDNTHRYPISSYEKMLIENYEFLQKLQVANPTSKGGTQIMGSPFCEHNHDKRKMGALFNKLKIVAPNILHVNSIWRGEEVPGTITEIHIPNKRQLPKVPKNTFTISFDGFGGDGSGDFTDVDIRELLTRYFVANLRHIRAWHFRANGKYGHQDEASIHNRQHFPNEEYIRGCIETLFPREGGYWATDRVYKTFADDHGNDLDTSKDCHAMCILPVKKNKVEVRDSHGNLICMMTAPRINPDHAGKPKGRRFYAPYFSTVIAEMAYKKTGSYLIRINGEPPIDARMRNGLIK